MIGMRFQSGSHLIPRIGWPMSVRNHCGSDLTLLSLNMIASVNQSGL